MRLLALLAAGLLAGGSIADDKKPKDEEAILGTWKVVTYDGGKGVPVPSADELDKFSITFKEEDKAVFTLPEKVSENGYTLDPTAKPKEIDITGKSGTSLGIYALDGNKLTLAIARGDRFRPTEFKTVEDQVLVATLKRVKDEKDK
jgi:uncharacterized protein (TIGR03067 family)